MGEVLRLLLLSDIHMALNQLMRLKQWYHEESQQPFDLALLTGDFDSIDVPTTSLDDQEASFSRILQLCKSLSYLRCPIVAIPGNHDPEQMFREGEMLPNVHFIHKGVFKLGDLTIAGFGGSVPALSNEEQVWAGYPFSCEADFKKQFQPWFESVKEKEPILLATHIGPLCSQTTVDFRDRRIETGSASLQAALRERRVVVNVHGHCHAGKGLCQFWQNSVVNPGALKQGSFGVLTLARRKEWRVRQVSFYNLNQFNFQASF